MLINTRAMDVSPPHAFIARTVTKFQAFHSHQTAFTVKKQQSLQDSLATSPLPLVGCVIFSHTYTPALHITQAHLISSSNKFRKAIHAARQFIPSLLAHHHPIPNSMHIPTTRLVTSIGPTKLTTSTKQQSKSILISIALLDPIAAASWSIKAASASN